MRARAGLIYERVPQRRGRSARQIVQFADGSRYLFIASAQAAAPAPASPTTPSRPP